DERLHALAQRLARRARVEPAAARLADRRRAQVHPRAERVPRAPDEQRTDSSVASGLAHDVDKVVAHLDGEGVAGVGAIERDAPHVVVADVVSDHARTIHGRQLGTTNVRPCPTTERMTTRWTPPRTGARTRRRTRSAPSTRPSATCGRATRCTSSPTTRA